MPSGNSSTLRAHQAQTFGERRDAVAFLHAQFLRVVNLNSLLRERSERCEHGQLVNHFGDLRAGNRAAGERSVAHGKIADEFAVAHLQRADVNRRADGNQKIENFGARGIQADVVERDRRIRKNHRGADQENGRGEIARNDELACGKFRCADECGWRLLSR